MQKYFLVKLPEGKELIMTIDDLISVFTERVGITPNKHTWVIMAIEMPDNEFNKLPDY